MAKRGPKVGEIVLGVAIEDQDIAKNLTHDIAKEIEPGLVKWHERLEQINKDIAKIKKESYGQRRRNSGLTAEDFDTTKALEEKIKKQDITLKRRIKDVNDAVAALNRQKRLAKAEENRTGSTSTDTDDALRSARERLNITKSEFVLQKETVDKLKQDVLDRRIQDEKDFSAAIQEIWRKRMRDLEDKRDEQKKINDAMIIDAENRSAEAIAQGKREYIAKRDFFTNMEKLEEKREREANARARRLKKEQEAAEAEAKKFSRAVISATDQSIRTVGSLVNLGRVAPPVLLVIASFFSSLVVLAAELSQVIYAVPAAFGAVGAAAATLGLAFYGLEDAITAALDPNFDGEKLAEALAKISPAAADFVLSLRDIMPAWQDLQQTVGGEFFAGLGDQLKVLADAYMPMLSNLFGGIAAEMNNALMMASETMMSGFFMADMQTFSDNVIVMFQALQPAIVPLVEAFGDLMAAGSSALPVLAEYVTDLAIRFSEFINEAEQSGDLEEWIENGVDALIQLLGVVEHLIESWFEMAPVGDYLLPTIIEGLINIIDMLPGLITLFASFAPVITSILRPMAELGNVIMFIAQIDLANIVNWFTRWLNPLNLVQDVLRLIVGQIDKIANSSILSWLVGGDGKNSGSLLGRLFFGTAPATQPIPTMPDGSPVLPWVTGGGGPIGPTKNLDKANRYAEGDRAADPNSKRQAGLPRGVYRRRDGSKGGIKEDDLGPKPLSGEGAKANKEPTDAEKRKANEASINPEDYMVDVSDVLGDQPGNPGQPPLAVNVESLPDGIGAQAAAPAAAAALPAESGYVPPSMWDAIAYEESRNDWGNDNTGGHMTSSGAPRGGLQITDGTWAAYGGTEFAKAANLATREQQIAIAERIAFEGYNGTKAQGLGAWEVVTQGKIPGVTAKTSKSEFDSQQITDAINNQPGSTGKPPLKTEVTNLPKSVVSSGAAAATASLPADWQAQLANVPDAQGAKPVIDVLGQLAKVFDLNVASGLRFTDNGHHSTGNAGDFSNQGRMGPPTPEMTNMANALLAPQLVPYIAELIYEGSPANVLNGQLVPTINQPGSPYTDATAGYHGDHVHVAVKDENVQEFLAQLTGLMSDAGVTPGLQVGDPVPTSLKDNLYTTKSPLMMDTDGTLGYMEFDQQAIDAAATSVKKAADDLQTAGYELAVAEKNRAQLLISEQDLIEAQRKKTDAETRLNNEKADLREKQKGKFKEYDNTDPTKSKTEKPKPFDYNTLPKGHPMRFAAGFLGGLGADDEDLAMILGGNNPIGGAAGLVGAAALAAAGPAAGAVAGEVVTNALSVPLPGPMGYQSTPTAPNSDLNKLVQEQNPAALAQAANIPVPDYSRAGGGESAQDVAANSQTMTANGQVMSDTAALIDRSFTNLDASDKARHDQTMAVLNEIKARLGEDVFGPAVADATTAAFQGAAAEIGDALGQTAAPPIAAAVKSAVPQNTGGGGGGAGNGIAGFLSWIGMAAGGGVTGGTAGKDSVPAMLMPGEFVLTAAEVQRMGGFAGVESFRAALARQGGMRFYAAGGNVGSADANKTVGADFFGVSQVPIVGGLINLLIQVLLRIIDVQIEQRDTLMQVSDEFRSFRGEFKAFDAVGRLMNDTSGLTDRSSTSEQEAADERIRILKLVIEGIVKFVIEKVVVPISKAVANAVIQAGASGVSGGLSTLPGGFLAAPLANALISGTGQAAVEIGAEVYTALALSIAGVVIDVIGDALAGSEFGDAIFGGAGSAQVIDPIAGLLNAGIGGISATLASIIAALTSLFGGAAMDGVFDSGGLANGTGLMPKATLRPERVLSPEQTRSFDRLVDALASGKTVSSPTTTIHAPFTVMGDERGARRVHDRLLALTS